MSLPYPTWTKGPSPKQVYAAFGDTYVGYVPIGLRIKRWQSESAYGTDISPHGNMRKYLHAEFSCVSKLDMAFGELSYLGYDCDKQAIFVNAPIDNVYTVKDIPRWQMFFLDTLGQYPRLYGDSSFYLFEDFVINDDHDILQWAKYARKATWRALESLNELPKRG